MTEKPYGYLFNQTQRVIQLSRVVVLMPESNVNAQGLPTTPRAQPITEEQFQQLRRDPIIRHLIADGSLTTKPLKLFDLLEDPSKLDPVPMPTSAAHTSPRVKKALEDAQAALEAKSEDIDEEVDLPTSDRATRRSSAGRSTRQVVEKTVINEKTFNGMPPEEVIPFVNESEDLKLLGRMFSVAENMDVKAAIKARGDALTEIANASKAKV